MILSLWTIDYGRDSTGKLVFVTVFVVVIVHIRSTVVSLVTVTFEILYNT